MIGYPWEDSECELEEKEEEGVRFCGDLLRSLFSSESLFSPPSGASPAPRRLPPLARVEEGECRPCFFIGFIFSPNKSFYLFIQEILFGSALFFYSSPSFLFSLFSSSAGASLSHPVLSSLLNFSTCPPYSRGSERKGTGSVGYSCGKHFQTCTKLDSLHKIATNCMVFGRKSESKSKHL